MITLASLFQDHAVLQRNRALPVWGWGPPRARVCVTLGPHVAEGFTSARGKFFVWLPPLPAGGPHTLTVTSPDHPDLPPGTASDIFVGEVWLGSGQSNMAWTLAEGGDVEAGTIASADDPALRFFTVSRHAHLGPQDDIEGAWMPASPANAPTFSAVAYHFAQRLRRELGVPVGIIVSALGGTRIECWLSRSALLNNPASAAETHGYELTAHSPARWAKIDPLNPTAPINALPADPGHSAESAAWARADFDDSAWPAMALPSTWQKQGHDFSGVFWFRRSVELPSSWRGRDLELHLGAADKHDTTWVNGSLVGRTGEAYEEQHWNHPRVYPVPANVLTDPGAMIAVRVYSFAYNGGLIGPAAHMFLTCPSLPDATPIPLHGDWRYSVERDFGVVVSPTAPGHLTAQSPHMLFDNMIAPLAPYALRGALWYQGENNASRPGSYASLLRDLIAEWRHLWAQGDFPFFIVQLPLHNAPSAHDPDSGWASLREAQLHVAQSVPGAELAVILDAGEAGDIHPKNKAPVGHRLAQLALATVHGRNIVPGGPLPLAAALEADGVRVNFSHTGSGLVTTDGGAPRPVFLRDASGTWHEATATLQGEFLRASAAGCPAPTAIAYAWAENPAGANLANSEGFPASPFRLDCA